MLHKVNSKYCYKNIFYLFNLAIATTTNPRYYSVDDYTSFYNDDQATTTTFSYTTTKARTTTECATLCAANPLCAGFKFNDHTHDCEIPSGCLRLSNTTIASGSRTITAYSQRYRQDLALGELTQERIWEMSPRSTGSPHNLSMKPNKSRKHLIFSDNL